MRMFHIQKINEHIKEQNKKLEESQGKQQMGDNKISKPNINPSSLITLKDKDII